MAEKLTVTQLNNHVHNVLEQDYFLRNVTVVGEVSGVKYYGSSGHIYFTLKDENAAIDAAMWRTYAQKLSFRLKDGDKIVATGKVTTFEKSGKIQFNATSMQLDGQGDLFKRFEQLKAELQEMGYFDQMYKKPLPKYINSIGVVTAPTGSAVQDIIKISKERNPGVRIVVYPAVVQGKGAENTIAKGIQVLDNMGLDVLIVGRGGGSDEDLWCFNEKIVADAIFQADTPIISAVGHQDDYSISDFVADLRAATPSDAAKNVYNLNETLDKIESYKKIIKNNILYKISDRKTKLKDIEKQLILVSPRSKLDGQLQRANDLYVELNKIIREKLLVKQNIAKELSIKISYNHPRNILQKRCDELKRAAIKLDGLSPAKKLASGFSYVQSETGENIKSVKQVHIGDNINIHLNEGKLITRVEEIVNQE